MQITFVSHASILVESSGRTVLCDPWLEGKVFNNGWALVSPPYEVEFQHVDYVWISHEHPDHLNFATLKRIAPSDMQHITLLYQRHASSRIADALRGLGFTRIIELPTYAWCGLEPGLEVYCGTQGKIDSFLAIRDGDACVLNLNDCHFNRRQLAYIKRQVGQVDVALTQFSFANWVGNERDEVGEARQKVEELFNCAEIVKPRFLVPFASYVYFCNQENQRMNAWVNRPADIARLAIPSLRFMYPGDTWDSHRPGFESRAAVERYTRDYAHAQIDPTPPSVAISEVVAAVRRRLSDLRQAIDRQPLLRAYVWVAGLTLRRMDPFEILLHDQRVVVTIEPATGTCRAERATVRRAAEARFVMCSQVAWYTFAFAWGAGTTQISGMYLDRQYAERGEHPLFALQAAVSSEAFRVPHWRTCGRVLGFWWRKRHEKLYDWVGSVGMPRPPAVRGAVR